jgi:hypothetical protein
VADNVWIYAVLSNNVYEDDKHYPIWIDRSEWKPICGDQSKDDCLADKPGGGLEVKKYYRWSKVVTQPSELVFVFRGTESAYDWIHGNIGDDQYEGTNKYVSSAVLDARKNYPDVKVIATGHSLGGGLAEHVAFCVKGAKAIGFNSSPRVHKHKCGVIDKTLISDEKEEDIERKNIKRIHQHDEILSPVRHLLPGGNYPETVYNFTTGSLLSRHTMTPLAIGLTKIAASSLVTELNNSSLPADADAVRTLINTCTTPSGDFSCTHLR